MYVWLWCSDERIPDWWTIAWQWTFLFRTLHVHSVPFVPWRFTIYVYLLLSTSFSFPFWLPPCTASYVGPVMSQSNTRDFSSSIDDSWSMDRMFNTPTRQLIARSFEHYGQQSHTLCNKEDYRLWWRPSCSLLTNATKPHVSDIMSQEWFHVATSITGLEWDRRFWHQNSGIFHLTLSQKMEMCGPMVYSFR